jgi:hypothetical protein
VYCLRIMGDALSISAFFCLNSGVHYINQCVAIGDRSPTSQLRVQDVEHLGLTIDALDHGAFGRELLVDLALLIKLMADARPYW